MEKVVGEGLCVQKILLRDPSQQSSVCNPEKYFGRGSSVCNPSSSGSRRRGRMSSVENRKWIAASLHLAAATYLIAIMSSYRHHIIDDAFAKQVNDDDSMQGGV